MPYMTDRKQRVVLHGSRSCLVPVTSGAPQGSVLGPVLFLLFINDIGTNISSTLRLYADDALVHAQMGFQNNTAFQQDLLNLPKWAENNVFNIKKCHSVFFGKVGESEKIKHQLCGECLSQTSSFKYLGVTITVDLKWDTHIANIVARAKKILGLLKGV